jgi:hypothetical protein
MGSDNSIETESEGDGYESADSSAGRGGSGRFVERAASLVRTLTVSSVIVTIISVARLLIVSNYQIPTAAMVAQSLGTVSTLVGTLIPFFGALLPIVAVLAAVATFLAPLLLGVTMTSRLLFFTLIASTATAFTSPTSATLEKSFRNLVSSSQKVLNFLAWGDYLPVAGVLLVLIAVGSARASRVRNFHWERYMMTSVLGLAVVAAFIIIAVDAYPLAGRIRGLPEALGQMWLAPEIVTTSVAPQRVGYVLSVTEKWTTILWESDRTISLVPADGVISREVCRLGPPDEPPLFSRASPLPVLRLCVG